LVQGFALQPLIAVAQPLVLLLAGWASAASLAWPFAYLLPQGQPQWWLQIFAMAVFCQTLLRSKSVRGAFGIAYCFAVGWLAGSFWWLFIAMHQYGGLNAALAAMATFFLAAALALYYGLAALIYRYFKPRPAWASAVLFGFLWTAAELARGTWLTGFGWGAVGYAHTNGPLSAVAPWLGLYGVCLIAAAVSMALAQCSAFSRGQIALCALIGLAALWQPESEHTQAAGSIQVALLQGNIPQSEKFEAATGVAAALRWYAQRSAELKADLVAWPETAVPLLPQELPPGYWDDLSARFGTGDTALLTGIPLGSYEHGYTNSVVGMRPGSDAVWRYDKHHLVPFGEFIPPLFKWFTRMMNIPLGDFNRGTLDQASFAWKGQRLAAHICYEDLFGEELGVRFRDVQTAPTAFVNFSNIGWFGDTVAIDQHLQIARMRSLELQRPFVRATNTGATAIIDHRGQVTASLPRLTQGVLVGEVQGRVGTTPYAWWVARTGLLPFWIAIATVVGLAALGRRRAWQQ
jgi:apolipoprotein N-acyltransferase